jgi:glycerol kinase
MQKILAIDQSTSATKALLYDTSGKLIDKASIEHKQIYPQPGWVEHDAEEILRNTFGAIAKLDLQEVQFLSITNQRETIVVFDRATGKPLHNAIVWQDRRGEEICHEFSLAGHGELVARKTGLKIDPYFSAPKLTWLMQNRRDIAEKIKDGQGLIGTIDTYLIYNLTNCKVFATDHTNASRTLLFDISRLQWDHELCRLFLIPMRALPEPRESTASYGTTNLSGREIPICGVIGDSQASLLAHRCFAPGAAKVTIGSGSSVLLNVGTELRRASQGAVSTVAWTHAGKPTYCFEGIINYSAATIQWLKDQLGLIRDPAETESAACAVANNGGVYLVPAFVGLSAPYWSSGARAAIVGMTAHTNRNHLIRAALESIAYQIRDVLDMMRSQAQVELRTINADGGATRNRFLMQFIADITGLEVNTAQIPDCSPLGAAMAGMLGLQICRSLDELSKLPREVVTYRPSMPADQVEQLYAGWKRAVKQVLAGAAP